MKIEIRGRNLPGRTWRRKDEVRDNVHVAVQERKDPVGWVGGDARSARWHVDVEVVTDRDGNRDFRGPAVQGKKGDRFLYLTWGEVGGDGSFAMFRRAKLMLGQVDSKLVSGADSSGRALVATIDLTDEKGGPRCARVDPPALTWALA